MRCPACGRHVAESRFAGHVEEAHHGQPELKKYFPAYEETEAAVSEPATEATDPTDATEDDDAAATVAYPAWDIRATQTAPVEAVAAVPPAPPAAGPDILPPDEPDSPARQRRWPAMIIPAVLILAGLAVGAAAFLRPSKHRTLSRRPATTAATKPAPAFSPGDPRNPALTTTSSPAPTTTVVAPVVPPAPTPPPPPPSAANVLKFTWQRAACDANDTLTVVGTVTNTAATAYTAQYTVTIVAPGGSVLASGTGSVAHVNPNEQRAVQVTGHCNAALQPGATPQTRVDSINPV